MQTDKTLGNTDVNGTRKNVPDVVVYGNGDTFALWVKASSKSEGWLKSTKVANVHGGALVQTETQQRNPDGSYALSQALTFVPYVWLDKHVDPPEMITIGAWLAQYENNSEAPCQKGRGGVD